MRIVDLNIIRIVVLAAMWSGSVFAQVSSGSDEKDSSNRNGLNSLHRNYEAREITDTPKIDGILNDRIWQEIEFTGNFLQREPHEGLPATEKTEFALAYDGMNLYIAARCYDSQPQEIRATEMRRDEYLWDDDNLEIIFDTFDDKRSSFYFSTNALGIRIDGKVNDEGKNNNRNWDGVWHCKTSIDDRGWYVEMAIPWQTLRFKEGDGVEWNANFIRMIRRKNEYDYWRLIPIDLGRNGKFRMSEGGRISGFNGLTMGGKYEFLPYFSGGYEGASNQNEYASNSLGDMGLDLKWNVSSNLTSDFTFNTDFAQVEADQERVNLTRFSLFFPEKREFFLEGAETFGFGQGSGGGHMRAQAAPIQLFHSRRIGINEGYLVPITAGTRLQGKTGQYTIGLMSIQTEKATLPDDELTLTPTTNFSVLRLKRDVFSRSSVGIMLLNKDGGGHYNRSLGLDSYFPVTNNLSFFMVGAGTYSPDEEGEPSWKKNNFAGNFGFDYNSDRWNYSASLLDIEDRFNPEMGFITRTDIRKTDYRFEFAPRPERWDTIRQFKFNVNGEYQTDHSELVLNRKITGKFDIDFENSANLSFTVNRGYEFLDYDWEVREDNFIPSSGYNTTTFRLSYRTSRSDAISGNFNMDGGGYFNGKKYGGSINTDLKAFNSLRANLNYNYNWIDLPDGEFHTNSLSTRISYSFNPDLFIKAYIQFLDDKLRNEGHYVVSTNILLRYIYNPGSNFYLVFNEGRMIGTGNEIIDNRTVLTKFTYFFRR
ncbi:DUF5916 domain-containing protein [candidate division KSB1 bacterium]